MLAVIEQQIPFVLSQVEFLSALCGVIIFCDDIRCNVFYSELSNWRKREVWFISRRRIRRRRELADVYLVSCFLFLPFISNRTNRDKHTLSMFFSSRFINLIRLLPCFIAMNGFHSPFTGFSAYINLNSLKYPQLCAHQWTCETIKQLMRTNPKCSMVEKWLLAEKKKVIEMLLLLVSPKAKISCGWWKKGKNR